MANSFRKVGTEGTKAIKVTIRQSEDGPRGQVFIPTDLGHDISIPVSGRNGKPVPQALDLAINLAEKSNFPIVIEDEDNIWKKEWGELI